MKKIFLILLAVCIVLPVAGFGQAGFGFLAGINLSNFSGNDASEGGVDPSITMGFAAGAFVTLPFSDMIAFRAEALYSQKGAKYEELGESIYFKMDYIEVPLMIQLTLQTYSSIIPIILVGGYMGFDLTAKLTNGGSMDMKDEVKSIDYGIMFGGGALISNLIELSARYSLGLASVADEEGVDVKNNVIQIFAGIHL